MTPHRKIIPTVALAVALSAATPAVAPANSLLSGYGGPGQGNQAILGSALLNGPPSGGGGPAGAPSATVTNPGAQPGRGNGARIRSTGHSPTAGGQQASDGAFSVYPASERGAAQPSGTLGLSGKDLVYILLTFGLLVFTGLLTRRFTRRAAAERHG